MSEEITPEIFNRMVELAALELDAKESEYLRRELNHQLNAIHELEEIPLEAETAITSHGVPYTPEISPAIREDQWVPFPDPGKIIAQAPETQDGYIVVPDIPHTDLE